MAEPERSPSPLDAFRTPPPERRPPLPWGALAALAVLPVLAGLGATWLPPWLLGIAVAGYLAVLLAASWWRDEPPREPTPAWRDIMPCYLSVQDRELRIVSINERFREAFGDRVGEHCYEVYKDRTSPCPGCPVLLTFEDGKIHSGEETVTTQDGRVADVVLTSAPVHNRRGEIVAAMEMSTDITELKALRRELARSRRNFQQLFDIVPCYITIQDREYRIVESNELFRRDFGQQRGAHCYRAYKDGEGRCPNCPVELSFEDGEVHSGEEVVVTRDGRRADVIVHSMPVRDEAGEITGVMEVSTNITEVKQLQQQLAMMGLAVAGMAHRAKNILMGLEGGIFVVNEGFETDDQALVDEGWEMVERNVERVSRVVKDLLFCSKERVARLQDGVAPAAIVRDVYELFRDRAESDGIQLQISLEDEDHTGRYDPEGLHSMVANLTANALDACRFDLDESGKQHAIELSCWRDAAGDAVIAVTDNGAGIPEDAKRKIFQGFFSTKGSAGTGLGLMVVQRIVESHGGSIHLDSTEGEGTTFTVTLPAEPPEVLDYELSIGSSSRDGEMADEEEQDEVS